MHWCRVLYCTEEEISLSIKFSSDCCPSETMTNHSQLDGSYSPLNMTRYNFNRQQSALYHYNDNNSYMSIFSTLEGSVRYLLHLIKYS